MEQSNGRSFISILEAIYGFGDDSDRYENEDSSQVLPHILLGSILLAGVISLL